MFNINLIHSKQKFKYIWFNVFFSLYLIATYLNLSMLVYIVPVKAVNYFSLVVALILLLRSFIFERFRFREIILIMLCLTLTFFIAYKIGNIRFFTDSLIIISCKGIDFRNIIKNYLLISFLFLIFITISSQLGIVTDLVFYRDGEARHSLGLMYPTVYSARFFFLVLAYLYLRMEKLSIFEVILLLAFSFLLLKLTGGRLDCYLMILSILLFYFFSIMNIKFVKLLSLIGCMAPILGALLSYLSSFYYNNMNPIHAKINTIFSSRLFLGHWALSIYKPLPFGQVVIEQGNGGLQGFNNIVNQYFFIDSSYLSVLLKNGWIFFIGLLLMLTYRLFCMYKAKRYYLILAWSLVCINSIVATFLFSVPVNVFILFLFSNLDNESLHTKISQELINNEIVI